MKREGKRGGDKCSSSDRRSKVDGAGLPRQGDWDVRDLTTANWYLLAGESMSGYGACYCRSESRAILELAYTFR